jgi:sulfite exporter TauE/SafE
MGSLKKNLTIVLGVVAGAALTAFAVSKSGKEEIKRLSLKTAKLRDELLNVTKDLTKIKRTSEEFI